ncbi:hypothetical protein K438DRAFT_1775789 [Mycena galopus ATCC 62051]|nr:hypothetical protein K438DRAFT_1775789 [Mycena galopus ATCC 62051]
MSGLSSVFLCLLVSHTIQWCMGGSNFRTWQAIDSALGTTLGLLNAIIIVHIQTLHKIYTFVEAQQKGSKIRKFFRQRELSVLHKDCKAGLQQGYEFFQIKTVNIMADIIQVQEDARKRHQEVLSMIEALSNASSERSSTISRVYSESHNSSNSILMLPSGPKIFHGRQSELSDILELFRQDTPRIAIGGMGKTSLARAVVHHEELSARYQQYRFFVSCDATANKVELAALIGAHLGLKPGKDLTRPIVQHFSSQPPSLLILDNLETLWEPAKSRGDVEEFLSLLTDVEHLALMLTVRDAPMLKSLPQSKDLLSLLSVLPDELSDVELVQSKLPIDHILSCTSILIGTALAYWDEQKRLKALVPIREHIYKIRPPKDFLIQPLLKHFQQLLEFFTEFQGTRMGSITVSQLLSNFANIQNVLRIRLLQGGPDLKENIYCACYFNRYCILIGRGTASLFDQIPNSLPQPCDPCLVVYFMSELFGSWRYCMISDPEDLVSQALEHFVQFDDPDVKCKFYISLANYYQDCNHDSLPAMKFCQAAIALAISTGNTKRHSQALNTLAWTKWYLGDYSVAQAHAHEAQMLARIRPNLLREAFAVRIEAMCWYALGDYKQAVRHCSRTRNLLSLCGMSGCDLDLGIMNTQAEIHKAKSEYEEAQCILTRISQQASVNQEPHIHAATLINITQIDLSVGASTERVQQNIDKVKSMLSTAKKHVVIQLACDCFQADLNLREGDLVGAKTLFCTTLRRSLGNLSEIVALCLERLGDVTRWKIPHYTSSWTTVFLAHSLKSKERLGIYKALQFYGDIFLAENNEDTATSLFTVALQGFTQMDVHRSRAHCLLQLGDISKGHGDLPKAVELWEMARPLFERSLQVKQVDQIDARLAGLGADMLVHCRQNLAWLADLNPPTGNLEKVEDDLSDIEELELEDEANGNDLVVV